MLDIQNNAIGFVLNAIIIVALSALILVTLGQFPANADQAKIENVTISRSGDRLRVNVTVAHGDTGWEHYADKWDILNAQGELLGTRILYHPHVEEQPFTRSHTIDYPEGETHLIIRVHDKVHGYSSDEYEIKLP